MSESAVIAETITHKVLLSVLLLIAFAVPFHFAPIGFFLEEFIAGAAAILGGVVAWACAPRERAVSEAFVLWLVWGVVMLASYLNGSYLLPAPGLWALIYWTVATLAILWFGRLSECWGTERTIQSITGFMVLALIIQVLLGTAKFYGFLRVFNIAEMPVSRMPGLLNQYNVTAAFITVGLISVLYLSLKRKLGFPIQVLLTAMGGFALSLTDTRAVWLYFAVILIAIGMYLRSVPDRGKRRTGIGKSAAFFAALLLAFYGAGHVDGVLTSIGPADLGRPSIEKADSTRTVTDPGIRFAETRKVLEGVSENPYLGVGPNNYPYFSFEMDARLDNLRRSGSLTAHSHNIFTMILAEQGIIGLAVFLVLGGYAAFRIFRLERSPEWFWLASILGVFFVYSNVEYPLWYLHYLVLFFGVLTLALPARRITVTSRAVAGISSIAVVCVFLVLGFNLFRGYAAFIWAHADRNWSAERVQEVTLWSTDSFVGPYGDLLVYQYLLPRPTDYQEQLDEVEKVIRWRPQGPALATKIMLLVLMERHQEACEFAEKAIPFIPSVYKRLKVDLPVLEKERGADIQKIQACIDDIAEADKP